MHLTDEQLNEYLDHESKDRPQVELHLSACANCAARLAALQSLFNEIESLPEVALSRDLAEPLVLRLSGRASLPRLLQLTTILQFTVAMIALVFAAPFVTQFLSSYLSDLQVPSLVDLLLQVQTQWTTWLAMLSQLQLPGIPRVPVFGFSSLFSAFAIIGVSVLWLFGNGLLLRHQIK